MRGPPKADGRHGQPMKRGEEGKERKKKKKRYVGTGSNTLGFNFVCAASFAAFIRE